MSEISLAGKVALITGGAGAIGTAFAGALLKAGASVAAVDVSTKGLQRLADELKADAKRFMPVEADAGSWPQAEAAVKRVTDTFGSVDIVVNNAALFRESTMPPGYAEQGVPLWDIVPEAYGRMLTVNAIAQFYFARAAIKQMMTRKWGRIINVSTSFDSMFAPRTSAYGAAKAAIEVNTVVWAKELTGSGVTVNVLIPGGPVDRTVPIPAEPKLGEMAPQVMAPPLVWLASDYAKDVTGSRIIADEWNVDAPASEIQTQAIAPAAWPALAKESAMRRAVRIKERGRAPWPGH